MSETNEKELSFDHIQAVRYLDNSTKISKDCHFTSVDVTSSYLVVGTSVGTAFLYNRKNGQLQKLDCDIPSQAVTCICCLESVDLVIALGTTKGLIIVFQVLPTNQQMERYLINGVHNRAVRCFKWNQNGIKLFSGDDSGIVALTEMDYLKHESKSKTLFHETCPIVQIDYCKRTLLVSTKQRTFLADIESFLITQVGQKERKSLGNFGANFYVPSNQSVHQEAIVFASRPAFRLWKANCEGRVLETFIFKDNSTPTCQLLHLGRKYTATSVLNPRPELQFGPMHLYREKYLVTWSYSRLMVLAIGEPSMIAKCDDFENIRSVSLCGDEIYVLDGFRRITRIASTPDKILVLDSNRDEHRLPFKFMPDVIKNLSTVAETKFNMKSSLFESIKPTTKWSSDRELTSIELERRPVEENVVTLNNSLPEIDFNDNFDGAGSNDSVVYESAKPKKKKNLESKPPIDNAQQDVELIDYSQRLREMCILGNEALHQTNESREEKERRLAEKLNLFEIAPSYSFRETLPVAIPNEGTINSETFSNSEDVDLPKSYESELPSSSSLEYQDIYKRSFQSIGSLGYGPPSGSSNVASLRSEADTVSISKRESEEIVYSSPNTMPEVTPDAVPEAKPDVAAVRVTVGTNAVVYNDTWVQHKPPRQLQSLAVCDTYMVCTDTKDIVYYSLFEGLGLEWHRTEYPAKQISVSPSGKRVWRIHNCSAYALHEPSVRGPFGIKWMEVALDVQQISVHESCVWHVSCEGDLFCQTGMKLDQTFMGLNKVTTPSKIASVSCNSTAVLTLTMEGEILWRTGITEDNSAGTNWLPIKLDSGHIFGATLGNSVAIWIVDETFDIWFLSNVDTKAKAGKGNLNWWQVKMSDYIYQSTSTLKQMTLSLMDSFCAEQLTQMLGKTGNVCLVCHQTRGIWFYDPSNNRLLTNQRDIVGHRWQLVESGNTLKSKWKVLTASGVYHHHGGVWLWAKNENNVLVVNPTTLAVYNLKPPPLNDDDRISCLNAAPDAVWLLTKMGRIFIRKDITANNSIGSKWVELDLTQITHHKLVHVCCGSNLVWAVDSKGVVLMRIGSLQVPSIRNFPPAWVVVDEDSVSTSVSKPIFTKVYVGSLYHIVWAIDSKKNVYVRQGIFDDILIGLGWVLVSGIQAESLTISEEAVYALTPMNTIYRRYNITSNNYIGDYWKELPGRARQISVTVDDKLWALDLDQLLMQHSFCEVIGGSRYAKTHTKRTLESGIEDDDDWEVINYEEKKTNSR